MFRCDNSLVSVLSFGFGGTNACAMSRGENRMTTRSFAHKDTYNLAVKKLSEAPAQEVTINGEDWEDWEMDGPDRFSKPNDKWEFEVDLEGEATYEKIDVFGRELGGSYYLTGSMNSWDYGQFVPDLLVEGLYSVSVFIGETGQEHFQVVADMDQELTFHPGSASCTRKSAPVLGPDAEAQGKWCIKDSPGSVYRIEFYKSEMNTLSLSWCRESAPEGSSGMKALTAGDDDVE